MTENLQWQEIHDLIRTMLEKAEKKGESTRVISRVNYTELLGILRNFSEFQHNRNIKLYLNCSDGLITIQIKKKKKGE